MAGLYIFNHRYHLSLGSDESSTRHRSILVVNAIEQKSPNGSELNKVLGIVQLPGKDGETIVNEILSILANIEKTTMKLTAPEFSSLSTKIDSFIAYTSDHIATNGKVFRQLKKEIDTVSSENENSFDWIRCLMHKYNLFEDHLIAELRKNEIVMDFTKMYNLTNIANIESDDVVLLEDKGGMKANFGNNIHCATDFLYRLSRIMAKHSEWRTRELGNNVCE